MPDKPAFILLGLDGAVPYILEEGLDAGSLPNFRRLLERGVYAHNIPFTSAVTPGNWAAIGSGARPAALGISDFHVHVPGEPLDQWHGCFDREWCLAEPLWESLSRQGKRCATISFPSGYPRSGEHHLAIGDNGAPYENSPFYNVAPARLLVGCQIIPRQKTSDPERRLLIIPQREITTDYLILASLFYAVITAEIAHLPVNRDRSLEIPLGE